MIGKYEAIRFSHITEFCVQCKMPVWLNPGGTHYSCRDCTSRGRIEKCEDCGANMDTGDLGHSNLCACCWDWVCNDCWECHWIKDRRHEEYWDED